MRNNGEFILPRPWKARTKDYFRKIVRQPQIQLMAFAGVFFLILFNYLPMFGLVFAFKDVDGAVDIMKALRENPWVGFKYFEEFIRDDNFLNIILNTICISLLQIVIVMPASLFFALLISEVKNRNLRSGIECFSFFPNFVSWIVYGSIVVSMLSVDTGVVNSVLMKFGLIREPLHFLEDPKYFWGITTISALMKNVGWGSVLYLSAISTIDQTMYEAAKIDGANRMQRILHITIPSILAMVFVQLIFSMSQVLNSDFAQIWMLQKPLNLERSEVLDLYIAKVGFSQMRYSYVTAVGMFKSVIGTLLLVGGNAVSTKLLQRRLF